MIRLAAGQSVLLLLNQTKTGQLLPHQSICIVCFMYCFASWPLVVSFFGQVQVQEVREAFINVKQFFVNYQTINAFYKGGLPNKHIKVSLLQ